MIWAEATVWTWSMADSPPPVTATGSRSPASCQLNRAPIAASGPVTRFIGRFRRLASPSKSVVIGYPAAAPISRRTPVPALPQSMTPVGCVNPPCPVTRQRPWPRRSTVAPKASTARAVARMSSPSSRPSMSVTPFAMAPRIRARWEIDLSPGARTRPDSAGLRRAVRWAGIDTRRSPNRSIGRGGAEMAFDSGVRGWQGSRPFSPLPPKVFNRGQTRTGPEAGLPELPGQIL